MSIRPAEDERWMRRALERAGEGVGLTAPNPPVGAVVVRAGRVVGEGWHRGAGRAHAERLALERAGTRARDATLYVTLEPCCTQGRTPPCTDTILTAGLARVCVAVRDPNPKHDGRGLALLRAAGMRVDAGVCAEAAAELLAPFARWVTAGVPFLTLKLAMSADGRIADRTGRSRWITGPETRRMVHALRRSADAVLIGAGTASADNPSLWPRPARGRRPWRIVADGAGLTPPRAVLFNDAHAGRTLVAVTAACPATRRAAYERHGAETLLLPGRGDRVSLPALARALGQRGVLHVLCEGGGELAADLVRCGWTDRMVLCYAPCLIGGQAARAAIGGPGWLLRSKRELCFTGVERHGRDLVVFAQPAPVGRTRGTNDRKRRNRRA